MFDQFIWDILWVGRQYHIQYILAKILFGKLVGGTLTKFCLFCFKQMMTIASRKFIRSKRRIFVVTGENYLFGYQIRLKKLLNVLLRGLWSSTKTLSWHNFRFSREETNWIHTRLIKTYVQLNVKILPMLREREEASKVHCFSCEQTDWSKHQIIPISFSNMQSSGVSHFKLFSEQRINRRNVWSSYCFEH